MVADLKSGDIIVRNYWLQLKISTSLLFCLIEHISTIFLVIMVFSRMPNYIVWQINKCYFRFSSIFFMSLSQKHSFFLFFFLCSLHFLFQKYLLLINYAKNKIIISVTNKLRTLCAIYFYPTLSLLDNHIPLSHNRYQFFFSYSHLKWSPCLSICMKIVN